MEIRWVCIDMIVCGDETFYVFINAGATNMLISATIGCIKILKLLLINAEFEIRAIQIRTECLD